MVQYWSVIIPVWNGLTFLPQCLQSLEADLHPDGEIIAVDNGSTDGSADYIAAHHPRVRLLRNAQNLGFAQACNTGMRAAQGQTFLLLNQDTYLQPGCIAALQQAYTSEDIGIVGCKIIAALDGSLQHAGGRVHELLGAPFHDGKDAAASTDWDTARDVEYVTGAALAIRRPVFEQIGGFDERFFPAYYEDVDLCFRARAAGFRVRYCPDAIVSHYESTSTPNRTRWFYFQRGRLRFVLKHWPPSRLLNEFPAAEIGFQAAFRKDFGSTRPLRLAYTAARVETPIIVAERWPGDHAMLMQVSALFRQLHRQAVMDEYAELPPGPSPSRSEICGQSEPDIAGSVTSILEASDAFPSLTEFDFRSDVPVLGGFLAAVRRACYGIAAKWALRHLRGEQQAINQAAQNRLQRLERLTVDLSLQQEALVSYLGEREAKAVALNRFLLDNIMQAEEEALFALLWPLRWDLVLPVDTPR